MQCLIEGNASHIQVKGCTGGAGEDSGKAFAICTHKLEL